ncbi:MAG: efflux RND transporter permease subunit [Bacillota bacterium]
MNEQQDQVKRAYIRTLKTMTPVIMTAMITTALSFLSLQASPVPMIRDFGIMLMVGVVVSFLLMVLVLGTLLFVRDYYFTQASTPKKAYREASKRPESKRLFHFMKRLIEKTLAFRGFLILLALLAAGYGFYVDRDARVETDVEAFMPRDSDALDDIHTLRDRTGSSESLNIVYATDDVLDEETLEWTESTVDEIEAFDEVVEVQSVHTLARTMDGEVSDPETVSASILELPKAMTGTMISDDHDEAVITIMLDTMDAEAKKAFIEDLGDYLEAHTPSSIEHTLAGQALVDTKMISALTYDRYTITFIGIGLVFLSLLLIYRRFLKAFMPMVPVVLLIGWTSLIMHLFDIAYTPLTATLGALTTGIAVDFSILVAGRVHEERTRYASLIEALSVSLAHMFKPIGIAALTTMGGFSVLLFSDFQILFNFGIMTVVTLAFALLSVVFVLPSFLYMQGTMEKLWTRQFAPSKNARKSDIQEQKTNKPER